MGTPSRRASSRASAAVAPRGSPVAGFLWARTGLPKLIAARSLPVGASSLMASAGAGGMAVQAQSAHAVAAIRTDLVNHDLLLPLPVMGEVKTAWLAPSTLVEADGARSGREVGSPEPWGRTLRRLSAAVKN